MACFSVVCTGRRAQPVGALTAFVRRGRVPAWKFVEGSCMLEFPKIKPAASVREVGAMCPNQLAPLGRPAKMEEGPPRRQCTGNDAFRKTVRYLPGNNCGPLLSSVVLVGASPCY